MIHIRPAQSIDALAIAECHIAAWRDTYRQIVADEYLKNLRVEDRAARWIDNLQKPATHTLVAQWDSDQIIGFINGGPERSGNIDFRGEIYAIYILKKYRGASIGRQLLGRFVAALLEDQITSLIVWVLEGNVYRACYAAWGGLEVATAPIKIGEQELVEVAYGWKDIRGLA